MAIRSLICPDWPYHVVVEWTISLLWPHSLLGRISLVHLLFVLGKRSSSGCLCHFCARMFPSNALWPEEEVSFCAIFSLHAVFYCLPSSLLIAAFLQDTLKIFVLNPPDLIFDWGKQTASHLPLSVSWSPSFCSRLQFLLQTCSEAVASLLFSSLFSLPRFFCCCPASFASPCDSPH